MVSWNWGGFGPAGTYVAHTWFVQGSVRWLVNIQFTLIPIFFPILVPWPRLIPVSISISISWSDRCRTHRHSRIGSVPTVPIPIPGQQTLGPRTQSWRCRPRWLVGVEWTVEECAVVVEGGCTAVLVYQSLHCLFGFECAQVVFE